MRKWGALSVAVLILATGFVPSRVSGQTGWSIEIVAGLADVGQDSISLALDGSSRPHIAFYNSTNTSLDCAHWDGTKWVFETVYGMGDVGRYASLKLDVNSHSHISYSRGTDLYYSNNTGGSWAWTAVDVPGDVGTYASLALKDGLFPRISYYDSTNTALKFAKLDGAGWSSLIVDNMADVGQFSSLALDSSGNPHISYYDATNMNLKHAWWDGASWQNETVDSYGTVGRFASIAVDPLDRIQVSYANETVSASLKHAAKIGSTWFTETVDPGPDLGLYTSIAIDPSGLPRISYYDLGNGILKLATSNGLTWTTEVVDDAGLVGDVGWYTSLAIDSLGNPAIAYWDFINKDVKYARGLIDYVDLFIGSSDLRLTPAPPYDPGTSVTINATVHNNGNLPASSVLVRFYDGAPVPANQIDGDRVIPSIPAGGSQGAEVTWTAQPMGEHCINVVVDPDNAIAELSEVNNRATMCVKVKGPDVVLQPTAISWDPPGNASLSSTLTITANVSNVGDLDAASVLVRFWDGAPGTIQIGADQTIPLVPAGEGRTSSVAWVAMPLGTHQICVQADPADSIQETNESNNDACTSLIVTLADLAANPGDLTATPSGNVAEGTPVTLDLVFRNVGGIPATGFNVSLVDVAFGTGGQTYLENRSVSMLPPGGAWSESWTWAANTVGRHVFYATVDSELDVQELTELNNELNASLEVAGLSDLLDTRFTAIPAGPVVVGSTVALNATWANLGNGTATANFVMFEDLNQNSVLDPGEQIAAWRLTLPGQANQSKETGWNSLLTGSHRLCALADSSSEVVETNESNNLVCIVLDVLGKPDLTLVNLLPSPPIRAGVGETVQISVHVMNQGGSAAGPSTLAFYNQTMPPTMPFNTVDVPTLAASETSSKFNASWQAPAIPGEYVLVAYADYTNSVDEANESNNFWLFTVNVTNLPRTTLSIGDPNYTSAMTFITSLTPLSLSAKDFSGVGIKATWYDLDSSGWVAYTAPITIPPEGMHTLIYMSEDNADNVEFNNTAFLVVDNTPPVTTVSFGEPKYVSVETWIDNNTPLTFLPTDGGPVPVGVNFTEWRAWNGTIWSPWTPYVDPVHFPSEDSYTMEFRSMDHLGNVEAVKSIQFKVDDTPPELSPAFGTPQYHTGTLFEPWYVTSLTPISASAVDQGQTAVGVRSLNYSIDGAASEPLTGAFIITQEGSHSISFFATDHLGHGSSILGLEVIVDSTPPSMTIDVDVPKYVAVSTWVTSSTMMTLSVTDGGPIPVGVDEVRWRAWNGAWLAWADYLVSFSLGTPDGVHHLEVEAADLLGNSALANATFLVDDTAPTGEFLLSDPNHTATSGELYVAGATTFLLSARDGGAAASGISLVEYRVDAFGWTPQAGSFDLSSLGDGGHVLSSRVTDNMGHSSTDSLDVVLDKTPPASSFESSVRPGSATFWINATDAGAGVNQTFYSVDGGPLQSYTGAVNLAPGDHVVTFHSEDNVSNVEEEKTESVAVQLAGTGDGGGITPEETNIAPLIAGVLTLLLFLIAMFWARSRSRKAMLIGIAFAVAEASIGLVSFGVSTLRIPPWAGAGLAVFVLLFLFGLIVLLWLIRSEKGHESETAPENVESGEDLEENRAEKDENESSEEESDKF